MKKCRLKISLLFACFVSATCLVHAEESAPKLGKIWFENQVSNPEASGQTGRALVPLPEKFYKYRDGKYQSLLSRVTLTVPVLSNESQVSVRESILSRRPNGFPITSHIVFVPGPVGAAPSNLDGVSAVVVTLLRDDRSKDSQPVLASFEPPNDASRDAMAQQGVEYSRVATNMGEAVQRIVRNRLADDPFPYKVQTRASAATNTFGITRYVVAPKDSLIEFSQVIPCGESTAMDCKMRALDLMQKFMAGVSEFLLAGSAPTTDVAPSKQ